MPSDDAAVAAAAAAPKRRGKSRSRGRELAPFVREQLRIAINTLASGNYLLSTFEQAAMVEKLIQEARETTAKRMAERVKDMEEETVGDTE
jgi:hypothetical protein